MRALSVTPYTCDWLANSNHPRVLHVFDCACNLINERREVLSIVTPQIGTGPFNLVIDNDVYFFERLSLESPVSISHTQLHLGDLTINTADAKLWNPCPDWAALRAKRDDMLNHLSSLRASDSERSNSHHREETLAPHAHLPRAQMPGSAGVTLSQLPITTYQSPVSNLQFSNSLISSLAKADLPCSLTATQKLAGLGVGLTPAGDDFILGAIYAAWIIHPLEIASLLAKEIANTAAPLTTSLSAAWLRSAGRGEAGILWHEFFDTLISTNAVRIQKSVDKILAVGETSGADALAGFFGTMGKWEVPNFLNFPLDKIEHPF
jgi:hypothetical protein